MEDKELLELFKQKMGENGYHAVYQDAKQDAATIAAMRAAYDAGFSEGVEASEMSNNLAQI